jgi:hypothetical protein
VSRRRQAASLSQLRLLDAAEVNPASSLCQRWSGGAHSWRRRRDGGFDRRLYAIYRVDKQVAKAFVERHHYLHSFLAERLSWGLFQGEELVGVAVLGVPSHPAVLTNEVGEGVGGQSGADAAARADVHQRAVCWVD